MNLRVKILSIALGIILLSACKKDDKPTMIDLSLSSNSLAGTGNLKVLLLSDAHRTTADYVSSGTTDSNGKIDFSVTPGQVYYIYNTSFGVVTPETTYIITGKFATQEQINSSPAQTPAAQIGDNIEMDINGDGVIKANDQVVKVTAPAKGTTSQVGITLNIPIP
jgi:hypothetical protein